nr:hypothetical protein [Prevotella sp.]
MIDNILSIFFVQYLSQFLKPILNTLPVRAKALKLLAIFKAFALTGRIADCHYTQGAALG